MLGIELCLWLAFCIPVRVEPACQHGAVTAPPRRRGPGPRPTPTFKYNLRSLRVHMSSQLAHDNLVSVVQCPASTTSSGSIIGSMSGKDKGDEQDVTLKDVVVRLAAIEAIVQPLQPLVTKYRS
jgi:hypothetical protein